MITFHTSPLTEQEEALQLRADAKLGARYI